MFWLCRLVLVIGFVVPIIKIHNFYCIYFIASNLYAMLTYLVLCANGIIYNFI